MENFNTLPKVVIEHSVKWINGTWVFIFKMNKIKFYSIAIPDWQIRTVAVALGVTYGAVVIGIVYKLLKFFYSSFRKLQKKIKTKQLEPSKQPYGIILKIRSGQNYLQLSKCLKPGQVYLILSDKITSAVKYILNKTNGEILVVTPAVIILSLVYLDRNTEYKLISLLKLFNVELSILKDADLNALSKIIEKNFNSGLAVGFYSTAGWSLLELLKLLNVMTINLSPVGALMTSVTTVVLVMILLGKFSPDEATCAKFFQPLNQQTHTYICHKQLESGSTSLVPQVSETYDTPNVKVLMQGEKVGDQCLPGEIPEVDSSYTSLDDVNSYSSQVISMDEENPTQLRIPESSIEIKPTSSKPYFKIEDGFIKRNFETETKHRPIRRQRIHSLKDIKRGDDTEVRNDASEAISDYNQKYQRSNLFQKNKGEESSIKSEKNRVDE